MKFRSHWRSVTRVVGDRSADGTDTSFRLSASPAATSSRTHGAVPGVRSISGANLKTPLNTLLTVCSEPRGQGRIGIGHLMSRTRILLSDDYPLVRRGLRTILEGHQEYEVCGEAGDGAQTLALAHELAPDVVPRQNSTHPKNQ